MGHNNIVFITRKNAINNLNQIYCSMISVIPTVKQKTVSLEIQVLMLLEEEL